MYTTQCIFSNCWHSTFAPLSVFFATQVGKRKWKELFYVTQEEIEVLRAKDLESTFTVLSKEILIDELRAKIHDLEDRFIAVDKILRAHFPAL